MNDLIRNLNDFVSENFPVDKVTPFLTDYDLKSDVIKKYCFFKDDKYSRNLVYKDEHFELLIVCWAIQKSRYTINTINHSKRKWIH